MNKKSPRSSKSAKVTDSPAQPKTAKMSSQNGPSKKTHSGKAPSKRTSSNQMVSENRLTERQQMDLLKVLQARFEEHPARHGGISWSKVAAKLEAESDKIGSLFEMERTGGEPDVVGFDSKSGRYLFMDCSPETPTGRRSLCYDRAGWESRKEHRPASSAVEMAEAMGIELLSEQQYRELQNLGEFDTKTSSWVSTPEAIRKLGGALFCDRRYGIVFLYHNGAQSYYAVRGFRGALWV